MTWKIVTTLLACLLVGTTGCLFDPRGTSDGDGDANGDADGDGDGDSDADVEDELRVTSVTPGWGYTTGSVEDPRGFDADEATIQIGWTGGGDGEMHEVLFDGNPLHPDYGAAPGEDGCVRFVDDERDSDDHYESRKA